mmetsp:Transcript_60123/g.133967  ORF Transcript_60123/g.133967 Transcript_60123/m.133967 type:complete len:160 (-) Transcript_60123:22-501(-)
MPPGAIVPVPRRVKLAADSTRSRAHQLVQLNSRPASVAQSGRSRTKAAGKPDSVAFASSVSTTSLRRTNKTDAANLRPAGKSTSAHAGSSRMPCKTAVSSAPPPCAPWRLTSHEVAAAALAMLGTTSNTEILIVGISILISYCRDQPRLDAAHSRHQSP